MAGLYPLWTKAILCRPKDNIVTEGLLRAQREVMVTTLERCVSMHPKYLHKWNQCHNSFQPQPVSMHMLIANEYQRMWLNDRREFHRKKKTDKHPFIENDFEWWLKLHKTNKCFCPIWYILDAAHCASHESYMHIGPEKVATAFSVCLRKALALSLSGWVYTGFFYRRHAPNACKLWPLKLWFIHRQIHARF